MQTTNHRTLTFLIMGIFSLSSLFGCKGAKKPSVETILHPPFSIEKKRVTGRRYDMNKGMVKSSHTEYNIFYKDQPISFPEVLERNSGYAHVWKAFILQDAPRPSIIAGSQSVYLVTEEGQEARVTPVNEQNSAFASLQWLDSDNGQPGKKREFYISDDSGESNLLEGGGYLLVNRNTVLKVEDLSMHPARIGRDDTDGYDPNNLIAFSPDKNKMVFLGSRYEGRYYYAIILFNFRTNKSFTLPFDQTKTRLHDAHDLPAGWFDTYFKWLPSGEGYFVLEKRHFDSLPNWEGHFSKLGSYQLSPVREEMMEIFANFIRSSGQFGEVNIKTEEIGGKLSYEVRAGNFIMSMSYLESLQSILLSEDLLEEDEEGCKGKIREIGNAFNDQLRLGQHQDVFTSY